MVHPCACMLACVRGRARARVCVLFNGIVLFSCSLTLSCTFIYEAQGLLALS